MKIFSAQLKGTTIVVSGSSASITGSFTGSIAGIDINATNTFTASTIARLNSIETISSSNDGRVGNIELFTSSTSARLNSIETISASNISRLGSLETTSASVDTLNTAQNSRLDSLEIKTGSLATTGSNTFIGTQTITGSLFISSNLIVQGTSSLQNITASAVSIGANIINLNTANPAIRYAGLVIGDSGSVGGSGSFLYDSVQDEFIFVHRGTSTVVTSSVTLMGPETYDNVGSETYPTANRIQKGTGNEHLGDSNIFDNGSTICFNTLTGSFSGKLGIGTTSTPHSLTIVTPSGEGSGIQISKSGYTTSYLGDGGSSYPVGLLNMYDCGNQKIQIYADGPSYFTGGNVGIGTTCIMDTLTVGCNGGLILQRFTGTDSYSGDLYFYSARGTVSSPTSKACGDAAMGIRPRGYNGSQWLDVAAIESKIEGTPTTNIICGNLIFFTNGGSTTLTERMRITATGVVELKQYIKIGTEINSVCNLVISENQLWRTCGILYINTSGTGDVSIANGGGKVGIGIPTPSYPLQVKDAGIANINTYFGSGQVRIGGGVDAGSNTVLSVAPGVITFDRPGVPGGTLTINSSGYVTLPSQPSFYVTSNAASTDYTTGEVIVFNTARHNTGSHYNTSTGRFTAPVAGKYLFTLNVYAYPSYTAAILLYVNGAQYFGGADVSPYIYTGAAATAKTISFTLIWELSASDYIEVRARSTTRIYRAHSHFSGQLLS